MWVFESNSITQLNSALEKMPIKYEMQSRMFRILLLLS